MPHAVTLFLSLWVPFLALGEAPTTILSTPQPERVTIDVTAPPARSINDYHLFRDVQNQLPNEELIPYDLNTALFADYAEKYRFLFLPQNGTAEYKDDGAFVFPVGAVLIKTFSYKHDQRNPDGGERILETRLLMHRPEGWVGYPYVWNDDLTDARLAVAGARIPVSWVDTTGTERSIRYSIPNMNQCKHCHENDGVMGPIGPKARQLNRSFPYKHGPANQIAHWIEAGILENAPASTETVPYMAPWDDEKASIDVRARSYLEGNCAHCHNPGGDAGSTGLDLSWSQQEPVAYGINKLPTAAGPASRGYRYAIRPARPDRSFLLSRLRATDPAMMMPRTGRTIVHEEGVGLIQAWIQSMNPYLGSETYYETKQ